MTRIRIDGPTPQTPRGGSKVTLDRANETEPSSRDRLGVAARTGEVDGVIGEADVDAYEKAGGDVPRAGGPTFTKPELSPGPAAPGEPNDATNRLRRELATHRSVINAGAPMGGDEPYGTRDAAAALRRNWDSVTSQFREAFGLSREALQDIVASDVASPEVKRACVYFLKHPDKFTEATEAYPRDGMLGSSNSRNLTKKDLNTLTSPGWDG